MRGFLAALSILTSSVSVSQVLHQNHTFPYFQRGEAQFYSESSNHTAIRPAYSSRQDTSSRWTWAKKHLFNKKMGDSSFVGLSPLLHSKTGNLSLEGGLGLMAEGSYREKVGGAVFAEVRRFRMHGFLDDFADAEGGIPSHGPFDKLPRRELYDVRAYLAYKPFSFLTLEAGRGKHFIGDGYRSMMLSDFSPSYPYARLTTSFWKLQYVNLYTAFSQRLPGENHRRTKYSATHMLSWNVAKWFNIGLFESIIFESRPGTGFDFHYLNPLIFYRPVEYAMGSADNALLGTNLKFTIRKKIVLYGQMLFDEFLLSQVRADLNHAFNPEDPTIQWGWWANKYAWQAGLAIYQPFQVTWLNLRYEMNGARPYTYSHGSALQSYSHQNYPLAHPLGANFSEQLAIADISKGLFFGRLKVVSANYGEDGPGVNSGRNVTLPYTDRVSDFYNFTGQGIATDLLDFEMQAGWVLHQPTGLYASLGWQHRRLSYPGVSDKQNFLFISLSSGMINSYSDR